jgi:hypothetical protein
MRSAFPTKKNYDAATTRAAVDEQRLQQNVIELR